MNLNSIIHRLTRVVLVLLCYSNVACAKQDNISDFTPDFIAVVNPNIPNTIDFTNKSIGDYTFTRWDFGNGESTGKLMYNNKHSVYYHARGEYMVTLTVWGEGDVKKEVTKTVTIQEDYFKPDFEINIYTHQPNFANLSNTTLGEYDKIKWFLNNRVIDEDNIDNISAYFAFKGRYEITLQVFKGGFNKSITKTVVIDRDDPDFLNKYQIVWSDEFNTTEVNRDEWIFETGMHGWGNNEWQNYTNGSNASVLDGSLKIEARLTGRGQKVGDYTSARLNSVRSWTYGRFEFRAKMPDYKGPGVWPALWMLGKSIQSGTSWPLCGELDIMEYVSWDPDHVSASLHTEKNNHKNQTAISSGHKSLATAEENFHVYGMIWTETFVRFYIDDPRNVILAFNRPVIYNKSNWPFDDPFYFLINIAVGGDYGGVRGVNDNIFPAAMLVDHVRVYQLPWGYKR